MKKSRIIAISASLLFITASALLLIVGDIPPGSGNNILFAANERTFRLNFNDADISEFLKMMGELTGKNIIADDKVRGKITVVSAKPIPVSEAYNIMKSILQIKGFAVIESENIIKIVTIKDAVETNSEVIIGEDGEVSLSDDNTVTYIYEVKYQDVAEIRKVLNILKSRNSKIVSYDNLNYIIISGVASEIKGLIKIAQNLDKPIEEEELTEEGEVSKGNIHVVHLQNANAEELAGVLSRVPFSETAKIDTSPPGAQVRSSSKANANTQTSQAKSTPQTKLSIIANTDTNSLIITATPEEYRQIKTIINQLDIVREQVLIEALIIEVAANNGWGFGIDWMLGGNSGQGTVGGSQILNTNNNFSTSEVNGLETPLPVNSGFQLGYLSDTSKLGIILLNASASDEKFNVLSTPQILTIDNQEAEISVGEQFPVPTNNQVSDDGTTTYSYEYKEASLKLKITPHITKGGKITLELYQEVTDVQGDTISTTSIRPPDITTRNISTQISINDGKTVVVGGLISNDKSETVNKVPVLGDIPVLGWLFKRKSVSYEKKNLLVFITPHIVTDPEKLDKLTKQKNEEIKIIE